MEEKERFESKYNEKLMKHYAFDNENKEELGYKGVVRVLNQQDKKIKAKEKEANTYAKEIVFLDNKIKLLEQETYPAYKREHQRRAYLENIEVPKLKERIKELEKKLDNARQKDIIIHQNCRQGYIKDLEEMNNLREENQQLNQQLHDLPKNIVEDIKQQLFNHFKVKNIEEYEKLSLIDALFTADTVIEILDTILKSMEGKKMEKAICNECGRLVEIEDGEEWGYCPFCENDQVELKREPKEMLNESNND